MAFIDIKDPKKRDQIVADYLSTIKQIQQRNEDEKAVGFAREAELEKTFKPIVQATEKASEAITKELKPLQKEPRRKRKWGETAGLNALEYYLKSDKKDKYYGIQRRENQLVMGDREVFVDEHSNISIDGKKFIGTPGLWTLIMQARPTEYTDEDYKNYAKIVFKTDLIDNPQNVEGGRPRTTFKWKLLEKIMIEDGDEDEDEEVENGEGIQFLPRDIKGLSSRLNLLLAEYRAGNTATRNEIVAILDELLRRKRLSRKEYTDINNFLS